MLSYENDRRTRAEQRVLASLLNNAAMIRHCPQLTPRDFAHDLHGLIFLTITKLIASDVKVSARSVFVELSKTHMKSFHASGLSYLVSLEEMPALPSHVGYYAAMMLDNVSNPVHMVHT